jgi:hypothetical protein
MAMALMVVAVVRPEAPVKVLAGVVSGFFRLLP